MNVPLTIGRTTFAWGSRTYVMGILNITPDSFSVMGLFPLLPFPIPVETALQMARRFVEEGVDILDVGGESTRPGARSVSLEEELARVLPVIKSLASQTTVPISIDTYKADVAEAALQAGRR